MVGKTLGGAGKIFLQHHMSHVYINEHKPFTTKIMGSGLWLHAFLKDFNSSPFRLRDESKRLHHKIMFVCNSTVFAWVVVLHTHYKLALDILQCSNKYIHSTMAHMNVVMSPWSPLNLKFTSISVVNLDASTSYFNISKIAFREMCGRRKFGLAF